jgi:phenylacetic acid degradation operon negative regulatory protein
VNLPSLDIQEFIVDRPEVANISCRTIIVTLFGDVVSQHGDWIWLGSLIDALEPLGYSERLVRTSVFRLVKEDWLEAKKIGRKSYYRFTETANLHYTKAARRIYATDNRSPDDHWLILMPSFVDDEKLPELKRQLKWMGFSPLSSGAYAHPRLDQDSLDETIKELKIEDSVVVFSARTIDSRSLNVLKKLVFEKWELELLQQRYQSLISVYQPVLELLENRIRLSDQQIFLMRVLLIHEYRRILLQDHELSDNMLPENWQGHRANHLVKSLYKFFQSGSNRYIVSQLQTMDGYLPKAKTDYSKRFS